MAKAKTSVKTKIFNALNTGESFTSKQLARKANTNTVNVSRRVHDLRMSGVMIYANPTGKGNVSYRIGTPSRAVVAAGLQALAS
jgi:predicted transcriptional regulator